MVKLPSFEGLKKFGADFIDATKAINVKEVVDHFKGSQSQQLDEEPKQLFQRMRSTLQELNKSQPNQENLIKQLEQHLTELEKIIGNFQKPTLGDKK